MQLGSMMETLNYTIDNIDGDHAFITTKEYDVFTNAKVGYPSNITDDEMQLVKLR